MAAKKTKSKKKNSLVANINKRKKAGKSRPKSRSHVTKKSYAEMEAGWPHSKKAQRSKAAKKETAKKSAAKKTAKKAAKSTAKKRAKKTTKKRG